MLVGEDPASQVYVNNKEKACLEIGFKSIKHVLPAETTEAELLALVDLSHLELQAPAPADDAQ